MIETWTLRPTEVVLALPRDSVFDISLVSTSLNLKVVRSERGQVAQRLAGFNSISSTFVLQMDDDILIDSASIDLLFDVIQGCLSCAVGPTLYKYPSGTPWETLETATIPRVRNSILRLLLGAGSRVDSMGKISRAGVAFGVDPTFMQSELLEVDWAPGGILLHRTENLVLENYFCYQGRASHEDLFHSMLLTLKGVQLLLVRESRAYHPVANSLEQSWYDLMHGLRINFDFVLRFGFSRSRFFFWTFYQISRYLVRNVLKHL